MKTTVINVFGSPGSGKSTLASELYSWMKKQGYSVELIREEIKEWAWQGKKPTVFEQMFITNKQMLQETSLYGKVEYLITDSPLHLGSFYCNYYHASSSLNELDDNVYAEAYNRQLIKEPINLYIPLDESIFNPQGRYSNLTETKHIDRLLLNSVLEKYDNNVIQLNCSPANRLINTIERLNLSFKKPGMHF
jgi:deoxyadenosine/deoxycytidine kinase